LVIFDVAPLELVILGGVALLVIPPKDLPRAMRFAGQWIGKARGMARQFRSGFDDMIREAEFAEMEKKWKAENERIMREFPQLPALEGPAGETVDHTTPEDAAAVTVTPPVMIGEALPVVDNIPAAAAPAPESAPAPAPVAANTPPRP
jgi:sec-independent protein translocase protein TatB